MFGSAVADIRSAFLSLDSRSLDTLFRRYGAIYKEEAESYARDAYPKWKNGSTKLSGQTMERLIELVPPYLSSAQRFALLQKVVALHKPIGHSHTVRINVKEPAAGFAELQTTLASMEKVDVLAHLPERVMEAASWLYENDITSTRGMLAQAEKTENDIIRASASREIALLQRTIEAKQVKSANYSVRMPAGTLNVIAYQPSMCFVATVCFGPNSPEVQALRLWRDNFLVRTERGRHFIVWYYRNGETLSDIVRRSTLLRTLLRVALRVMVRGLERGLSNGRRQ